MTVNFNPYEMEERYRHEMMRMERHHRDELDRMRYQTRQQVVVPTYPWGEGPDPAEVHKAAKKLVAEPMQPNRSAVVLL